MKFKQLFYAAQRKWWLIVLLVVLGGAAGYWSVLTSKPVYQAQAMLCIKSPEKIYSQEDLNIARKVVQQYYDILNSRKLITEVLNDTNNAGVTEAAFLQRVSFKSSSDSNVITINVKWPEAAEASAAVANAVGSEFITQVHDMTNTNNIIFLDEAVVPQQPNTSANLPKILLGLLSGFIAAFGSIYMREYFDTSVRSEEDIEKALNLRVLSIIPKYDSR